MYQIYPRSYQDSDGDGIGDLRGIISRLDYIKSLGIDMIWLSPVYQSPNDDNGYDISDYYAIHPEFGTMADFDALLDGMHDRGLRLIMDLVVNHTSDEHAWFQESRSSRDHPKRDWYIWRDGKDGGPPNNYMSFFSGSAWDYDETTDQYYLHYFTRKQPDLNWENPEVRQAIYKNMRYWLDKGVDGFRMDVISLLSKDLTFPDAPSSNITYLATHYYANGPRIHEYLQEMHREVLGDYDIMTVGEGPGITTEHVNDYIGADRDELNMVFQLELMFGDHGPGGKFDISPMSLVDIKGILDKWDAAIGDRGWNNIFLDNHDFPRMVSRFGDDVDYRERSAKMLHMFLLTMRGTPCVYQGSEIGMSNVAFDHLDDYRDVETINWIAEARAEGMSEAEMLRRIHVQGRDNVRTPMHWSDEAHAGFTTGEPWIKVNPNYETIHVAAAEADSTSCLHFFREMIAYRRTQATLAYGDYTDLYPLHEQLYIYERRHGDDILVCVYNFSGDTVSLPSDLDLSGMHIDISNLDQGGDILQPWEGRVYAGS